MSEIYLSEYPDDLIYEKLYNMTLKEILNAKYISKRWYNIVSSDNFWCQILRRDYKVIESKNCEKYYKKIYSINDKYKLIEDKYWLIINNMESGLFDWDRQYDFATKKIKIKKDADIIKARNILENNLEILLDFPFVSKFTPHNKKRIINFILSDDRIYYDEILDYAIESGFLYKKTKETHKKYEKLLRYFLYKFFDNHRKNKTPLQVIEILFYTDKELAEKEKRRKLIANFMESQENL